MRLVILTLLLTAPAFGQGGLATPVNPPPGFPNFYAPARPLPRPLPRPPLVIGPWTYPVIVPSWSWGTGYAPVPVPTVTLVERIIEVPPAVPVPPLDAAYLSSAAAARRRAEVAATVVVNTELTVTLPAAGAVWLDGVRQAGTGPAFVLAVTPGKSTEVRAEWAANGQTLEYLRTLTLEAGDKQAVAVFRGEVKK